MVNFTRLTDVKFDGQFDSTHLGFSIFDSQFELIWICLYLIAGLSSCVFFPYLIFSLNQLIYFI